MDKVKKGELDQLGLLFERYNKVLFSFFYNLHHNAGTCEDLVQNVFLRILRYRHNFRGTGEFKTWMFHIARNVHHDHHRRNRLPIAGNTEEWSDQLEDKTPDWGQQQISTEHMDLLQKALQQLPPDKREIIILSKLHGKKYREIGELIGCSEGTVKVKVFRALKALKSIYHNLEQ